MLTRIEIDGFKTFENFGLDLQPFSAIVGPNASGKSNLFDALKFLSLLAQTDIRGAMQGVRGEPGELFRLTPSGMSDRISFGVEVVLDRSGTDAFGTGYEIKSQRLRYELELRRKPDARGQFHGITVVHEACRALSKSEDRFSAAAKAKLRYSNRKRPFLETVAEGGAAIAFEIRQDGPVEGGDATKRGRPMRLSAREATRTALSTITSAEFPHLCALRDLLASTRFLAINPQEARKPSDRFVSTVLEPDAGNLAGVLARLQDETKSELAPTGVIADISTDLARLIPSVTAVKVQDSPDAKEYSFSVETADRLTFSSRVISDGTLRVLALLAILDDPSRGGVLCFEEPENGVHEGRIGALVDLIRSAVADPASIGEQPLFQIVINTHSPAVLAALRTDEVIAADTASVVDPVSRSRRAKTRMRRLRGAGSQDLFNFETELTPRQVEHLLRQPVDYA